MTMADLLPVLCKYLVLYNSELLTSGIKMTRVDDVLDGFDKNADVISSAR